MSTSNQSNPKDSVLTSNDMLPRVDCSHKRGASCASECAANCHSLSLAKDGPTAYGSKKTSVEANNGFVSSDLDGNKPCYLGHANVDCRQCNRGCGALDNIDQFSSNEGNARSSDLLCSNQAYETCHLCTKKRTELEKYSDDSNNNVASSNDPTPLLFERSYENSKQSDAYKQKTTKAQFCLDIDFPYDLAHGSVHGTHKGLTTGEKQYKSHNLYELDAIYDQLEPHPYIDTCPFTFEDVTSNRRADDIIKSDIDCLTDLINGLGDLSGTKSGLNEDSEKINESSLYHAVQSVLSARENESTQLNEKRMRALEKAKRFSTSINKRVGIDLDSLADDKVSAQIVATSGELIATTQASNPDTAMKAQYSFNRPITFPGFGLYDVSRKAVFLEKNAIEILDLSPDYTSTWVPLTKVLRVLGREVTHKIFAYARTLKDTSQDFINPCLAHGNNVCPYTEDDPQYESGGVDALTEEDLAAGPAAKPVFNDPNELLKAIGCPVHESRRSRSSSNKTTLAPVNNSLLDSILGIDHSSTMPDIVHKETSKNNVYGINFVVGRHERQKASNDTLPLNFDTVASTMQYASIVSSQYKTIDHNHKQSSNLGFRFGLFGVTPRPSKVNDPTAIMPESKCTEIAKSHLNMTHSNGNLYQKYEAVYLPGEHSRNRASLSIFLQHGKHAGSKIYVKINALFQKGKIDKITLTFTRVASYLFAMLPHVASESASFDLLTNSGECVFGSNYYRMLGYHPNDPKAKNIKHNWHRTVVHPDDRDILTNQTRVVISEETGNSFEFLYRSRCRNGSYIWTKSIGAVIARNNKRLATRVIGINIDINRVIEGYESLQSKVFTDILTGLKNRTYLTTQLPEIISKTREQLTVIFADITALKAYNDYLGHTVGDRLLCSAAILIGSVIDMPNDLIRISGDEIVCLIPDCNEDQAHRMVKKLEAAVKEYNIMAPVRMPVFFSCGSRTIDMREFTNRELNSDELCEAMEKVHIALQDADKIMQKNKKAAHDEHYALVKEYIEQSLKQKVTFNDKRLFA